MANPDLILKSSDQVKNGNISNNQHSVFYNLFQMPEWVALKAKKSKLTKKSQKQMAVSLENPPKCHAKKKEA